MICGTEYKGEWGDTVVVLRASEIIDVVYFIDELMFVDDLPIGAFLSRYKPTGRVNIALKNLFHENNFEREENVIAKDSFATSEGIQNNHKF